MREGLETIRWARVNDQGFSLGHTTKTHLRYIDSRRTFCRMPVPERAVVVEGGPECARCQQMSHLAPPRLAAQHRKMSPTTAEIEKALAQFLKDGGEIKKLTAGEALSSKESTT